jgi:hypothetical protein
MSHHFVLSATMQTVTIEVTQDHIDRLSKARNPVFGLAELIWNSVDADATSVDVRLGRNALGTIDNIRVTDNGLGITMSDAQMGFGHLGGSWKQQEHHTRREKRILHGKQGQGRFRAFALCERVEWDTVCLSAGSLVQFKIIGTTQNKRQFAITDEEKSNRSESGTVATLYNVITQQRSLESDRAVPELNKILALYLNEYPQVTVTYDGTQIQPSALEDRRTDYTLPQFTTEDGKRYEASLTIIEWKMDIERALYLCNTDGFTIREIAPGIQAPGYQFTAYLRSKLLEEMDEAGTIDMEEFTDLKRLLDITKEQLRKHFLLRDAENASGVVARWYDPESKPKLKERSQLHKLVSRNTWIFGDEYFLVNNDESLTNVLRKHVKGALLDVDLDTPVLRADGSKGVVDIGLSNIPSPEEIVEKDVLVSKILDRQPSEGRHHLIIELKRPSQDITSAVISQTKSYAFAVAADERFQNVPTNWTFWCLSNKMNEQAQLEAQLDGQPRGVVYPGKPSPARNYTMTIWAKSWAEVIEQCAGRLKFFQERLNYNASQSSGKQFLRDTYPKFIPDFVAKQQSNKP